MKPFLSLIALLCFAATSQAAVTAAVSGGILRVASDSDSDVVVITAAAVNDQPVTAFTGLEVNLKAGDDVLVVEGLKLTGDVKIAGGDGQDDFTLKDVECRALNGTPGYFPPAKSGITHLEEPWSFENVKCTGNLQITGRGSVRMHTVSGNIIAVMNASGIRGMRLDPSDTTCEGIKAKEFYVTFGRGDDTCTLTNCEVSGRLMVQMNFWDNDSLTRTSVKAGAASIMDVEHDVVNEAEPEPAE